MTNGEKFKEVFGFGADGSRVIAVNATWWDSEFQNRKPVTKADPPHGKLKKRIVYRGDVFNAIESARIIALDGILTDLKEHWKYWQTKFKMCPLSSRKRRAE